MCCCGSSKSKCRCCCCGKRGMAITFGLLGLALASSIIASPVYIYKTDQDYTKMFPVLTFGRQELAKLSGGDPLFDNKLDLVKDENSVHLETVNYEKDYEKTYKLAIFQLLNDIEAKAPLLAFVSFCLGCVNVPLYLFLLIGAIFRRPCPLLFWLIFALLELLLIGIPMIIFIGIICLYLACQLQMYIWASVLMGIVMFCFICTFSSWITVYKCYYQFKEGSGYDQHSAGGYGNSSDGQLTQPLLSNPGPAPPPLPPNHPSAGTSYQLGQYPQYYPPHGNRALPSAPPNIYPSLANA